MTSKQKQLTVPQTSEVAVYEEKPAFLTGTVRGSENVGVEDLIIPRLELCQPLSPCKLRGGPVYIEGIQDGEIFNTVTRQKYGESVVIVPVWFRKQWLLFRKRSAGGGFRGAYSTAAAAEAHRVGLEEAQHVEAVEAAEHFVLVLAEGRMEQAILTCTKTKLKVSRTLNSFVQLRNEDRFATAYKLTSVAERNDKGSYYNFSIKPLGFVDERVYNEGLKLWKAMSSGSMSMTADMSDFETEADTTPQEM